jgi:hypothetical protein
MFPVPLHTRHLPMPPQYPHVPDPLQKEHCSVYEPDPMFSPGTAVHTVVRFPVPLQNEHLEDPLQ